MRNQRYVVLYKTIWKWHFESEPNKVWPRSYVFPFTMENQGSRSFW